MVSKEAISMLKVCVLAGVASIANDFQISLFSTQQKNNNKIITILGWTSFH